MKEKDVMGPGTSWDEEDSGARKDSGGLKCECSHVWLFCGNPKFRLGVSQLYWDSVSCESDVSWFWLVSLAILLRDFLSLLPRCWDCMCALSHLPLGVMFGLMFHCIHTVDQCVYTQLTVCLLVAVCILFVWCGSPGRHVLLFWAVCLQLWLVLCILFRGKR